MEMSRPREYRAKWRQGAVFWLAGGFGLVGGCAAFSLALLGERSSPSRWLLSAIGLFFIAVGAVLLAALRGYRLRLFDDAIEVSELGSGVQRFERREIAGVRFLSMPYGMEVLMIEFQDPTRKPVQLVLVYERDAILDSWLARLTNLDDLERRRREEALLRSPQLGADEAERRTSLVRALLVSRGLWALTVGACLWGVFSPGSAQVALVLLAAVPLAVPALLALYPDRYAIDVGRNELRPGLDLPLLLPGCALMLRVLKDFQFLSLKSLLLWGAAGGCLWALALGWVYPSIRRRWSLLVMGLLLVPHVMGVLAELNAELDSTSAQQFCVGVLAKDVTTSGKRAQHRLLLEPWGPIGSREWVDVDQALYVATESGDHVGPQLRSGALGWSWFSVGTCSAEAQRSAETGTLTETEAVTR